MLTALTLRDFWLEDILPFSCCPMFMLPRNPFDEWPKWWIMTDQYLGRTREAGAMEPLYWSPASPVFEMSEAEARKLPQRVVWFGTTLHIPHEMEGFVKPEFRNASLIIQSNFALDPKLKELLAAVCAYAREGVPADAWDADRMCRLLALQDECLAAFALCATASRTDAKAGKAM